MGGDRDSEMKQNQDKMPPLFLSSCRWAVGGKRKGYGKAWGCNEEITMEEETKTQATDSGPDAASQPCLHRSCP
jgi:hypothetical protein